MDREFPDYCTKSCKISLYDNISQINARTFYVEKEDLILINKGNSAIKMMPMFGESFYIHKTDALTLYSAKTIEDIKLCIDRGEDVNLEIDEPFTTPFIYHCSKGNTEIVKYLVEQCNVDITPCRWGDVTGFSEACIHGHMDIFDYLITKNIKKDSRLLLHIIEKEQLDIMIAILPLLSKSDINISDYYSPVGIAVEYRRLDMIKHLHIYGANLNIPFNHGYGTTPLQYAKYKGYDEIVEYLSDYIHYLTMT